MQVIDTELFGWYCEKVDKEILGAFKQNETVFNQVYESHQWHLEAPHKRLLYFIMYGLLLTEGTPRQRILDIGGGITSLTTLISRKHDYSVMGIGIDPNVKDIGDFKIIPKDWYDFDIDHNSWDIIIANDIFPNVDQRLEMFLEKYLPCCGLMTLSLTYNNGVPKWYKTKRMDDSEILHMLSWTGAQVRMLLKKYQNRLDFSKSEITDFFNNLVKGTETIFPNKRQVCTVSLTGDLHPDHK